MLTLRHKMKGVTLLEVMLVLAIASSLLIMLLNYTTQKSDELRRDKAVLQIQQILNAGISFYINKSYWPISGATVDNPSCGSSSWSNITGLQPYYIPSITSPYGSAYSINCNVAANGGGFYVATTINNAANAAIIAGRLPLAYRTTKLDSVPPTACTSGANCKIVVANVNIPGQNLNNARSVNFASVYYSGSCVPAPNCPPGMKPNIMVIPMSVYGVNELVCNSYGCFGRMYPLNGFMAYARGVSAADDSPGDPNSSGFNMPGPPLGCNSSVGQVCYKTVNGDTLPSDGTRYWRVCLSVSTEKGVVSPSGSNQQQQGQLMGRVVAFTRCVPNAGNEYPSGSINVWQN